MKKPQEESSGSIKSTFIFRKHYQVSLMVAVITIGTLGVFGFVGHQLDLLMDSHNAFLVAGLILSFPVSQFLLYKWIKEKYIPNVQKRHKH